jgi:hypothetical protein
MKPKIVSIEDFLSGLLFIAVGLAAFIMAYHYPLGTRIRMGPGLLPVSLGVMLVLIGAGVCLQSLSLRGEATPATGEGEAAPFFSGEAARLLRPLLCVVFGMGAFALMVRPLGMVLAIVTLVLIVTQAESGFPIWLALLLAPLLALIAVVIFVVGLGLPFPIWP